MAYNYIHNPHPCQFKPGSRLPVQGAAAWLPADTVFRAAAMRPAAALVLRVRKLLRKELLQLAECRHGVNL